MSGEIAIQRQNGGKSQIAARRPSAEWDPFRTVRDLLRWDPFGETAPTLPLFEGSTFAPGFEVRETKENFLFTADLPGVAEKDLQIQLTGNRLSISGSREAEKHEQDDTYYASERSYGSFMRAFTLPEGINAEKVNAELKHGVLRVTVPKQHEAQSKKINVVSR